MDLDSSTGPAPQECFDYRCFCSDSGMLCSLQLPRTRRQAPHRPICTSASFGRFHKLLQPVQLASHRAAVPRPSSILYILYCCWWFLHAREARLLRPLSSLMQAQHQTLAVQAGIHMCDSEAMVHCSCCAQQALSPMSHCGLICQSEAIAESV